MNENTLEILVNLINEINNNGGCPIDTDCDNNCFECYKNAIKEKLEVDND